MQKKSDDFSMQEAMRLANTPAGQQLLAALKQNDPAKAQKAAQAAQAGNYEEAMQALNTMLSSPDIRQLLQKLGR